MMQWIPARLLFRIILSTQICIFKAMRSTQGEAKIKKKIYFLFDKSVKANFDICVVCCQCISDWKEGWQDRRGKPQSQTVMAQSIHVESTTYWCFMTHVVKLSFSFALIHAEGEVE